MGWIIGVDVGGTFTDFFAFEERGGVAEILKIPSTPRNPADAIIAGLEQLCQRLGIAASELRRLSHGTTIATNALIERRGARVALVTTKGFRDLLEIGRQVRPRMFDLQADYPEPLVPRERRLELDERIDSSGAVLRPLKPHDLGTLADAVKATGAEACAVCLLFSFINPAHERAAREAIAQALPGLFISLSSDVQPEFREYERLSTTVLNAYLQPVMERYLGDLERALAGMAPQMALGINQSSGGVMSLGQARRFPIRTALSGPAAGAVGAVHVARQAGIPDVITLDMGGTSADVALVRGYEVGTSFERWIEGYPARLPAVDVSAVGAGGGSIAWFDLDGLLKVGPASAGADPGPACYGRGGVRPTVTDANLVLGRLSPKGLLGGEMRLDEAAAHAAIAPVAERLGFSIERTAHGMLGIVVANMVRAARAVSVERGHDPRRFTLLAFGGAGPLHAGQVARSLGIRRVLVPPVPGILSAEGLVVSDLKESFVESRPVRVEPAARATIAAAIAALEREAEAWFARESIPPSRRERLLTLDMRYVGQNFELPVGLGDPDAYERRGDEAHLRQAFFAVHDQSYGFHNPDGMVEIVNFRLSAIGKLPKPPSASVRGGSGGTAAVASVRPVWFRGDEPRATPVYRRDELAPGTRLAGPAVIEQLDATTLLFPGDRLVVDAAGNLDLETAP